MKIAVIHYRSTPTPSSYELIKAINELGHEPVYLKIHELDAVIDKEVYVYRFREPVSIDGAIVRSLGLSITLENYFKRIGVLEALATYSIVINDPETITYTRDKWRSLLRLAMNNIPVPATMVTENPYSAKRFCEERGRTVYKPIIGSLGLGSALINDPDLAYNITRSLLNIGIPSYYQVFLEKPGYDYRVFVVGDNVIGAMKRIGGSGWKTNIAQGARGEPVYEKDDPELYRLALKTARVLGIDYGGIDIAVDTESGEKYVLEVNVFPQWKGLKTATGVDVAKHIVMYLVNKIKR